VYDQELYPIVISLVASVTIKPWNPVRLLEGTTFNILRQTFLA
jgi:hypothetical protein